MGVDKRTSQGVYDVLINGVAPDKRVVSTRYGDVLPSCKDLAGAGVEMIAMEGREFLLRRALEALSPQLRLHTDRLPPLPGAADPQRPVRR